MFIFLSIVVLALIIVVGVDLLIRNRTQPSRRNQIAGRVFYPVCLVPTGLILAYAGLGSEPHVVIATVALALFILATMAMLDANLNWKSSSEDAD